MLNVFWHRPTLIVYNLLRAKNPMKKPLIIVEIERSGMRRNEEAGS